MRLRQEKEAREEAPRGRPAPYEEYAEADEEDRQIYAGGKVRVRIMTVEVRRIIRDELVFLEHVILRNILDVGPEKSADDVEMRRMRKRHSILDGLLYADSQRWFQVQVRKNIYANSAC